MWHVGWGHHWLNPFLSPNQQVDSMHFFASPFSRSLLFSEGLTARSQIFRITSAAPKRRSEKGNWFALPLKKDFLFDLHGNIFGGRVPISNQR